VKVLSVGKSEKMSIDIRKARNGDAKPLIELSNEGLRRKFFVYDGGGYFKGRKDIIKTNQRFMKQDKRNFTLLAIDKKRNTIVGWCSVSGNERGRTRHRVDLGWLVHPDYVRKGIATRLVQNAIRELKKASIKRVEAEAAIKNIASLKLAKKLGFKIEGKKRKGLLLDNGKYVDTYIFSKILD
jgi:RimJ/RimL family protein N-acetyltransferase